MRLSQVQTTNFYKRLLLGFIALALLVFLLIIYFSLSKTVITVTVVPEAKKTSLTVNLKKGATADNSGGKIDGYLVSTTVEGEKNFTNTASGAETEAQATGVVTIFNNWSQEQPLAATTRLLTPDGTLFRIKDRVDVPAGGKVENVAVYADLPGVGGNIKPTKFTIPGLWPGLQEQIYAESYAEMTGGLRAAKILTQQEINRANDELRSELLDDALGLLENTEEVKNAGDSVFRDALAPTTLESLSIPEAGEEASSFTVSIKIKVTGVVFNRGDITALATDEIEKQIPDDEKITDDAAGEVTVEILNYNLDDQTASMKVTISTEIVPRLSSKIFEREKLAGLDEQEIKAYFSNFDQIGDVSIKFSPFWVSTAPSLKDHIEIKLLEQN